MQYTENIRMNTAHLGNDATHNGRVLWVNCSFQFNISIWDLILFKRMSGHHSFVQFGFINDDQRMNSKSTRTFRAFCHFVFALCMCVHERLDVFAFCLIPTIHLIHFLSLLLSLLPSHTIKIISFDYFPRRNIHVARRRLELHIRCPGCVSIYTKSVVTFVFIYHCLVWEVNQMKLSCFISLGGMGRPVRQHTTTTVVHSALETRSGENVSDEKTIISLLLLAVMFPIQTNKCSSIHRRRLSVCMCVLWWMG